MRGMHLSPSSPCLRFHIKSLKINPAKIIILFLVSLSLLFSFLDTCSADEVSPSISHVSCASVGILTKEIPSIRGLKFKTEVPCKLTTKPEVQKYLLNTLDKPETSTRLNKEEIIFKALGFIPEDFPYRIGLIELYRDQLGGYYDPEEKYYAMASWMPANLQAPIAVHELTHAVQDQHFNLEKLMDQKLSSDELLARSALVEGDATAVMTNYSRRNMGLKNLQDVPSVSSIMFQTILGASFGGSLKNAPPALQALLMFPYISGLKFAHALLLENGFSSIDDALKNPPQSTSEILHPEKYLRRLKSKTQTARLQCDKKPLPSEPDYQIEYQDILGEFGVSSFLIGNNKSKDAAEIAMPWVDDKVCLYQTLNNKIIKRYLYWEHIWENSEGRDMFLNKVRNIFDERFHEKKIEIGSKIELEEENIKSIQIERIGSNKSRISFLLEHQSK